MAGYFGYNQLLPLSLTKPHSDAAFTKKLYAISTLLTSSLDSLNVRHFGDPIQ